MSFYPSGGLNHHYNDQSSAAQFDGGPQPHQFDEHARVGDECQHQYDHHYISDTLASASLWQKEIDRNTEAEYHTSNTQYKTVQQRPFADLQTSSLFSDRSQLRQLDNENPGTQLASGWQTPGNDSTELPAVRLPSFIYREPLPPYVPDESLPEQYHGKVVPPERLGSYLQPRLVANPTAHVYQQVTYQQYSEMIVQRTLDTTTPVYPQVVSNFAPKPPPPPNYIGWSIVSMLCCCLLLGVAALVCSSGVTAEYAAGRYDKARSKSKYALSLNIASTIVGVLTLIAAGVVNGITMTNTNAFG